MEDTKKTRAQLLEENASLSAQMAALRQRSHEVVRHAQSLVQSVFEGVEQVVFVADIDEKKQGTFVAVNPSFENMSGCSEAGIIGKTYEDFLLTCVSPEIRDQVRANFQRCLATGTAVEYEVYGSLGGELGWWFTHLSPLKDGTGKIYRLVGTSVNMTSRRQAEEVLRASEAEKRLLNHIIVAAASSPDQQAVLELLCRELAQFFGVPQSAAGLLNEERTKFVIVAEYLEPGRPSAMGNEIPLGKDTEIGHRILVEGKAASVDDVGAAEEILSSKKVLDRRGTRSIMIVPLFAGDTIVGTIGIDSIVSRRFTPQELELAENAVRGINRLLENARLTRKLQESETRYALAVQVGKIGIWDFDVRARTLYISPNLKAMMGFSEHEMNSRLDDWVAFIHPEDLNRLKSVFKSGFEGYFPEEDVEFRIIRRDEMILHLIMRGKVTHDENKQPLHIFGTATDITERKNIEEQLEKAVLKLGVSVKQLEQRNREVTLLNEMGSLLQSCMTSADVYAVTADMVPRLFPRHSGVLYVYSPGRDYLTSAVTWGNPSSKQLFMPNECWALRRGQLHIVDSERSRLRCQHLEAENDPVQPYACIALNAQGEVTGMLYLQGEVDRNPEAWARLLGTVADQLALSLMNISLSEAIREHATRDPLTSLYNRQYMNETMEREFLRAGRRKDTIGVIMFDIDFFKQYNDTHGHMAGDALLETLGSYLKTKTRGEDVVCRFGGDEFVIIMPGANIEDVRRRAEQLRDGVKHLNAAHHGKKMAKISLSIGVAIYPLHGNNPESVLHAADMALLQAKKEGRSCIVVANEKKSGQGDSYANS
jgi:diguanylate cyclase (GGDEF)-like protein/PAS domain S-box-containing protein